MRTQFLSVGMATLLSCGTPSVDPLSLPHPQARGRIFLSPAAEQALAGRNDIDHILGSTLGGRLIIGEECKIVGGYIRNPYSTADFPLDYWISFLYPEGAEIQLVVWIPAVEGSKTRWYGTSEIVPFRMNTYGLDITIDSTIDTEPCWADSSTTTSTSTTTTSTITGGL